jgi:hypothetical protein
MSEHPSFVISVDNIDEHMDKIKNGGGVIKGVPQDIPGVGKYVPFVDSEGNVLSILQPSSEMNSGNESSSNSGEKKIIVRETFRAKPGQAGKLAKLFKRMMVAYPECRVMTDFIGEYNTVVMEMPVASLAEFEEEMKKMKSGDMGDMPADVMEEMKHYHEMFIEGKREVFEVV